MKKLLFAIIAATLSLHAAADDYHYLIVQNLSGSARDFALTDVRKITFDTGNMLITDYAGNTQELPLDAVSKLYFSAQATGIAPNLADAATKRDGIVGIYTLDGRRLQGTSPELLKGGVYLIRHADGTVVKVARK